VKLDIRATEKEKNALVEIDDRAAFGPSLG
jgi:hypothetical protein